MIEQYEDPSKPYRLIDGNYYIVMLHDDSFVFLKRVSGRGWRYPGTTNWEVNARLVVRSVPFKEE